MNERLVTFLYLLMRDELATGVVERLIREVELGTGIPKFSAVHLESYSRQLAERLKT